jgi:hypothetical protein
LAAATRRRGTVQGKPMASSARLSRGARCSTGSQLATALALLFFAACGKGGPAPVSYDLAALLPTAEDVSEKNSIDFGTPQEGEFMLERW